MLRPVANFGPAGLGRGQPAQSRQTLFCKRGYKMVDTPWSIAVGNDLRMSETVGPRKRWGEFRQLAHFKVAHGLP